MDVAEKRLKRYADSLWLHKLSLNFYTDVKIQKVSFETIGGTNAAF